ncbi:MAG: beta-N-acetylhexosaminidase [Clostridia bacterium]|nr:beta-N-acetylhexosaminidase [Clostridia bacterium]
MNVSVDRLPQELQFGAREVLAELGATICTDGMPLTATKGTRACVRREGETVSITYTRRCEFFRALSRLSTLMKDGKEICESNGFDTLCLMADMSRNAVMNVPTVKQMLRTLALMGYDSFMLYTEDTYEIEGEPYFGYMRGRYTAKELREIDDYADALGIEVIPCVQTLAHLEAALRWTQAYGSRTDIDAILLVGEERTYELIDRMLGTLHTCFRSRRINLGMDEAHNLGRGRYLDRNGYRRSSDIMLEHLERVVALCRKYNYAPMIWSDMFFRMAFNGQYYVEEGEIPPEVVAKVPKGLTLIHWDYYTSYDQKKRLVHTMGLHKKFNNPIAFAGGAWRWYGFAPHNAHSLTVTELHLDVCAENGVKDIIATAWGDNGAECAHFAILPSLLYYAEYAYCGKPDAALLEERARECFAIGFEELRTLDAPNELPEPAPYPYQICKYLLYNDPLEGLMDLHFDPDKTPAAYRANAEKLERLAAHPRYGYLFENLAALCRVLARKCDLSYRLRAAYRAGNQKTLAAIAAEIPLTVADLDAFLAAFRRQWYRENKTFGFAIQEQRIGGLRARLLSAKDRLAAYVNGEIDRIEELEQEILPFSRVNPEHAPYAHAGTWERIVTACRI